MVSKRVEQKAAFATRRDACETLLDRRFDFLCRRSIRHLQLHERRDITVLWQGFHDLPNPCHERFATKYRPRHGPFEWVNGFLTPATLALIPAPVPMELSRDFVRVNPPGNSRTTHIVPVARPSVSFSWTCDPRSVGIEMNVTGTFEQVFAIVDEQCLVPSPPEMSDVAMLPVEPERIAPEDALHPPRELGAREGSAF